MQPRVRATVLRQAGLIVGMAGAVMSSVHAQDSSTLPPLEKVGKWRSLPASNVARWRGTRQAPRNWNQNGFDASEWRQAREDEGKTYPAAVLDEAGVRYPIPPQIQYAIRPFWLPLPSSSRLDQNVPTVNNRRSMAAPVWFRQDFDFTEAYESCAVYMSQEVATTLYVNGVKVGAGKGSGDHVQRQFIIGSLLHRGRNTLAIQAQQTLPVTNALTVRTDIHQAYPVRAGAPVGWRSSLSAGPDWSLPGYKPTPADAWTDAVPVLFSSGFTRKGEVDSIPIWHAGDSTRQGVAYFRLSIDIAGLPNFGDCVIQADNAWELWVNGELAGIDKSDYMPSPTPAKIVQIGRFLHPGKNIIGVKAYNYGGPGALAVLPRIKISF